MAQDRFKARLYSEEKIVFIKGEPRTHSNRDGTLFSGNYSTKIIPSMLPDVSDTENQQRSDHGLLFLQVCLFRIGK